MRKTVRKLAVDDLDWVPAGTPGVFEKILNEDDVTGARTVMLKSLPRPSDQLTDRRPQYHPVDEEFFCLSGRFTLEGTPWLTPMSYVFYPPGLVHGFNVDVPDGYEVYLRNSGPHETERIESLAQDSLYFIADSEHDRQGVIVSDCFGLVREAVLSSLPSAIALREDEKTEEGTLLIVLPNSASIASEIAGPEGNLELFVLEGEIQLRDQERIGKSCYVSLAAPLDLNIASIGPSILILNYRDQKLATEIKDKVQNVRYPPNLCS